MLNELGVKGFVLRSTSVNCEKKEFSMSSLDKIVVNLANNCGGSLIKALVSRGLLRLAKSSLATVTDEVEMVIC
jgi:hypothetical protein